MNGFAFLSFIGLVCFLVLSLYVLSMGVRFTSVHQFAYCNRESCYMLLHAYWSSSIDVRELSLVGGGQETEEKRFTWLGTGTVGCSILCSFGAFCEFLLRLLFVF